MCRTGGPRCYSAAKQTVRTAERAFVDADLALKAVEAQRPATVDPADPYWMRLGAADARAFDAKADLRQAYGDLAATETGEKEIRDLGQGLGLLAGTAEEALANGQHQRRRGRIARAVRKQHEWSSLDGLFGRTGNARTDAMVDRAARQVAASPFNYKTPVSNRLPASVTGLIDDRSPIERWTEQIHMKAAVLRSEEARQAEADRDLSMMTHTLRTNPTDEAAQRRKADAEESVMWARNRVRDAEMELVVAADSLHQAERRTQRAAAA
jgi:hypothetical protein